MEANDGREAGPGQEQGPSRKRTAAIWYSAVSSGWVAGMLIAVALRPGILGPDHLGAVAMLLAGGLASAWAAVISGQWHTDVVRAKAERA